MFGSSAGRSTGYGAAPSRVGASSGAGTPSRFGPSTGYGVSAPSATRATYGAGTSVTSSLMSPSRTPGLHATHSFRTGVGSSSVAVPGHSSDRLVGSVAAAGSSALGSAVSHTAAARAVPSIGSGAASAAGSSAGVGGAAATPAAGAGGHMSATVAASHAARKEKLKFALKDVTMLTTVGTGTFGRVRVVQYKPTKQYFAMKILKKSEIIRLKQVDHIKSEVRILTSISHPYIVNLLGHLQDERRMYLLFEYVPGGELFSYLRRESRFPNDQARFYAAEIALAFEYLHSMNIVYRDLKPENLLFDRKGHMKITDFGFAKQVEDRTWTLCGTPEYLAPEIIQSKGHNESVDWWAIGILIFEMLAGYPPFYDESPFGIYQKILAGKIEFPKHFSPEARDLIRKLLTADKTKRLGCLRGGFNDIREHPWFAKLEWERLLAGGIPAPYVPRVKDEKDTSNFDDYPDSDSEVTGRDTAGRLTGKEADLFTEFDSY